MAIGADRKIWLPEANAGLSLWEGKYKRFTRKWLRWYNEAGWILTDEEEKEQQIATQQRQLLAAEAKAKAAAERAQQETEAMRRKNALLQEKLKTLGIDIEDLNSDEANE